jgi:hypothetical protein
VMHHVVAGLGAMEQHARSLDQLQNRHGHEQGSWPPEGAHAGYVTVGGRLYTALAVCTLEVIPALAAVSQHRD